MLTISTAEWSQWVALFFFPFVRIAAWLAVDPLLGNRSAPNTIRLALALVLAVVIAPTLPPEHVALVSTDAILVLFQQIAVGLAIGFTLRIVFAVMELAGQFIGMQMGLSLASLYDPINGAQTPALGQFLIIASALLLFATNGHYLIIIALWKSFQTVPIAAVPISGKGFLILVDWAGTIFSTGLHIALPITAALLAANLALGMMTRAAPQLNIFSVGFPITLAAGFLTLYFSLLYLPPYLERFWQEALSIALSTVHGLAGP